MNNQIRLLKKDFRGSVLLIIRNIFIKFSKSYWSFLNRAICFIKDVKIGNNTKFIGHTYFFRNPISQINIGANCLFNSNDTYNLIGINKKSIISTILPNAELIIGNNCGFSGVVIGCFKSIQLGDNIKCGANTLITDSDWHLEDPRSGQLKGIVIGDNVWIGINVVVLKGVTIGKNTVIGANSVVTKDIPSNVIAAGNPCKVIKKIIIEND